jgi:hypothetical protein
MPALLSSELSSNMPAQILASASRNAISKLATQVPLPVAAVEGVVHHARCLAQLRSKPSNLERYIFLNGLKGRDSVLFYTLLHDNMKVGSSTALPVYFIDLSTGNHPDSVHTYSELPPL